mgnify:CR=1 FL=1
MRSERPVNDKRLERGLGKLDVVVIDLVSGEHGRTATGGLEAKISSTFLREQQHRRRLEAAQASAA